MHILFQNKFSGKNITQDIVLKIFHTQFDPQESRSNSKSTQSKKKLQSPLIETDPCPLPQRYISKKPEYFTVIDDKLVENFEQDLTMTDRHKKELRIFVLGFHKFKNFLIHYKNITHI